jgi:ubiquinone/menaquinone biosynthesis C-methylase UbiE
VGTGRFAAPLGIRIGIDPAESMRKIARKRKIEVLGGVAEYLPFKDSSCELVLMITEITDNEIVSTGYGKGLFAVIHGKKN